MKPRNCPVSCDGSLGGKALGGKWLVRLRFPDVGGWRGSFFINLGEQPGLNRGGGPLSFGIIMCETAGFEDYRAQLGDAAAATVIEVHKRKAGPGHCVLQERDYRCLRQAMFSG